MKKKNALQNTTLNCILNINFVFSSLFCHTHNYILSLSSRLEPPWKLTFKYLIHFWNARHVKYKQLNVIWNSIIFHDENDWVALVFDVAYLSFNGIVSSVWNSFVTNNHIYPVYKHIYFMIIITCRFRYDALDTQREEEMNERTNEGMNGKQHIWWNDCANYSNPSKQHYNQYANHNWHLKAKWKQKYWLKSIMQMTWDMEQNRATEQQQQQQKIYIKWKINRKNRVKYWHSHRFEYSRR